MKKRKLRKGAAALLLTMAVLLLASVLYLIFNFNIHFVGAKSIHENSAKYKTRNCLVFYPEGENDGKQVAKQICSQNNKKDAIYDYVLKPYGDYRMVDYGTGLNYFVDTDNKQLKIDKQLAGDKAQQIISDFIRYTAKKSGMEEAFHVDYLKKTAPSNIELENISYTIEGDDALVEVKDFEMTLRIPLKYLQSELGINLGYSNTIYQKPRFIDPTRPMLAFTFDDGPNIETTSKIVDTLALYDGVGTFFCLGQRMRVDKEIPFIKMVIEKGNEYGSHTQSHRDLTKLSESEAKEEIMTPANDLKDGFGYQMQLYRPPYGSRNSYVDDLSPLTAIIWNVDSEDWNSRDKEAIKNKVYSEVDENDIVLFHDIYESTAEAIEDIVPYYVDKGYQLVTVSELMTALGIKEDAAYFAGR